MIFFPLDIKKGERGGERGKGKGKGKGERGKGKGKGKGEGGVLCLGF